MPKETETEETQAEETTSPWDSDLESAFEDEDVRKQVSDFLGQKVQPYVTKVEQEARPSRDATRLWDGFSEQPVETSIQVVKELYGDEIGSKFADLLQSGDTPEEAAATIEAETDVDVTDTSAAETDTEVGGKVKFEDLPPEVQNAVAAQEQEKQREAYYSEIDRVKAERGDDLPQTAVEGEEDKTEAVLDVDLFHPFVVAANGDFDSAAEAYIKWIGQAKEQFGVKVPEGEVDVPPTAINSETKDASVKPPQVKEGQSLDDALDDFFNEQKSPPPTVGSA